MKSYLTQLDEARANPALNPKLTWLEQLQPYIKPGLYLHFSPIPKVGINLKRTSTTGMTYSNPLGVYAWDLAIHKDAILDPNTRTIIDMRKEIQKDFDQLTKTPAGTIQFVKQYIDEPMYRATSDTLDGYAQHLEDTYPDPDTIPNDVAYLYARKMLSGYFDDTMESHVGTLPYFSAERPFIFVLKPKPGITILDLTKQLPEAQAFTIFNKAKQWLVEHDRLQHDAQPTYRAINTAAKLYTLIDETLWYTKGIGVNNKDPEMKALMWMAVGIDAIRDESDTLFGGERGQIVFVNPRSYEVVAMAENRDPYVRRKKPMKGA